ncbi:MAG: hypothetical protein HKN25_02240 [Pyrinomonadaceae bacterium]|nr:hypothetical protein [Pyrinomonadaceae bacterium]
MSSNEILLQNNTLNIPAFRVNEEGERCETIVQQINIDEFLIELEENIQPDEEFRIEIQMPNKNWLPLTCRTVERPEKDSNSYEMIDLTEFEIDLIGEIMSHEGDLLDVPIYEPQDEKLEELVSINI